MPSPVTPRKLPSVLDCARMILGKCRKWPKLGVLPAEKQRASGRRTIFLSPGVRATCTKNQPLSGAPLLHPPMDTDPGCMGERHRSGESHAANLRRCSQPVEISRSSPKSAATSSASSCRSNISSTNRNAALVTGQAGRLALLVLKYRATCMKDRQTALHRCG